MTKPICITFAGPYGCSKSPVAQYLSCQLGWPRLENDVIRKEIKEDTLSNELDEELFRALVLERAKDLVERQQSFIYDASVDRQWRRLVNSVESQSFNIGIVSFELSLEFYKRLIRAKAYDLSGARVDEYLRDHRRFLGEFSEVQNCAIICHINDDNFADRLALALRATRHFIADKSALTE